MAFVHLPIPGVKYWSHISADQREYWMHDCCEPECGNSGSFHPADDFTAWRCLDHWLAYLASQQPAQTRQLRMFD